MLPTEKLFGKEIDGAINLESVAELQVGLRVRARVEAGLTIETGRIRGDDGLGKIGAPWRVIRRIASASHYQVGHHPSGQRALQLAFAIRLGFL
jgi:hypothetical protein